MPALTTCPLKRMKENLNKHFMKKDFKETNNKPADEPIVIADECGDTLWDAVLQQEIKACGVKISNTAVSLLNSIDAAQECDATIAK